MCVYAYTSCTGQKKKNEQKGFIYIYSELEKALILRRFLLSKIF